MNRHQELALKHHCRLAGECVNPFFRYMGIGYSIVLTVNSGHE